MTERLTIAVIDDDRSVRRAVARLLRAAGFNALTFPSARAFLEGNHQKDVACLILDLMMPEMDGVELQRRLSDSGSGLPIIFITASENPHGEVRAREGGAAAYLRKPFDDMALLNVVHHVVSGTVKLRLRVSE